MSTPVTIIMIEDDDGHARLIERNIRRSGVNNDIIPFTNGTAAVNYLFGSDGTGIDHRGQALLILLDLNLPKIDGFEVLRSIRERENWSNIPVVVLSSSRHERDIKQCLALGATRYMEKPGDLDGLMRMGAEIKNLLQAVREHAIDHCDHASVLG